MPIFTILCIYLANKERTYFLPLDLYLTSEEVDPIIILSTIIKGLCSAFCGMPCFREVPFMLPHLMLYCNAIKSYM